jgi:hypothetical protein
VGWIRLPLTGTPTLAGIVYWAKNQSVGDGSKTSGPMVYFRAENGNYTMDGNGPSPSGANPHDPTDLSASNNFKYEGVDRTSYVAPAVDTKYSNFSLMNNFVASKAVSYKWVNDQSFQIFTSGLDLKYATPTVTSGTTPIDCLTYPTGESYWVDPTSNSSPYDDITNFSGGTLEAAMKSAPK